MPGGTVFFPARHRWLAEIIRLDSPSSARESARRLLREFRRSGRERRLRILRAVSLAATRARIGAGNPNYSARERREFREVYGVYRRLYRRLRRLYLEEG